jgi:hypothetical protein
MERSPYDSALSRYCGGLIEACWLAVLVAVPLLYDPQAFSGFEPFKAAYVRGFSLLALAAWCVRAVEGHGVSRTLREISPAWLGRAWVAILFTFCVSLLISTVLSVFPSQSFWGSYELREGSLTELCLLALFAMLAIELRGEARIRRLVTTIIVPTIPLSLLAIAERAGYNPLPFAERSDLRVISLEGNPIYLAAYLGMAFPFTLVRILERLRRSPRMGSNGVAAMVFYIFVGVVQVWAFALTKSRGPLLGVFAGIFFFGISHSAMTSRRRLAAIVAVGALALLLLAAAGIPSGPLAFLARIPGLERLSGSLPLGTPVDARAALWKPAPQVLFSSAPFRYPSGAIDRWHSLRTLIGFGPETLQCVLPQTYSFGEAEAKIENRFHDYCWDRSFSYGVVGMLAFLGLVALGFATAFRKWGLIRSAGDWACFWVTAALGVAGFAALLATRFGAGFAGLGVMCGLPLAFTLYVLLRGLSPSVATPPRVPLENRDLLLLSMLSALIVFLVEMGFAFSVPATALLFWVCLGAVVALTLQADNPVEAKEMAVAGDSRRARLEALSVSAIGTALMLVILDFAFVYIYGADSVTLGRVLRMTLTQLRFGGGQSHLLAIVLIPSWMAAAFAYSADETREMDKKAQMGVFFLGAAIAAAIGTIVAVVRAGQIASIGPFPTESVSASAVLAQGSSYENLAVELLAVCLLMALVWGSMLSVAERPTLLRFTGRESCVAVLAASALAVSSWYAFIGLIRADSLAGWGNALSAHGLNRFAADAYRGALTFDSAASPYRFALTKVFAKLAAASSERGGFERNLDAAQVLLKDGRTTTDLDEGALYLGYIYLQWAQGEDRPERRLELAADARRSFEEALRFEPRSEVAMTELSAVESIYLADPKDAADELTNANMLVSDRDAEGWFVFYARASATSRNVQFGRFYGDRALWFSEKALAFASGNGKPTFSLNLRTGLLHFGLGEFRLSSDDFKRAANEDHDPEDWKAEAYLAQSLSRLGEREGALLHLGKAITRAPAGVRKELEALRSELSAE